jgi:hypothetical protein
MVVSAREREAVLLVEQVSVDGETNDVVRLSLAEVIFSDD